MLLEYRHKRTDLPLESNIRLDPQDFNPCKIILRKNGHRYPVFFYLPFYLLKDNKKSASKLLQHLYRKYKVLKRLNSYKYHHPYRFLWVSL